MNIMILGAGQVGSSLAVYLANDSNNITVIDSDLDALKKLAEKVDIKIFNGNASNPNILNSAGIWEIDILIAATNVDEINMVACQIAYTLFKTPTRIARIRNNSYLVHKELFADDAIPINILINPEQIIVNRIKRLIEYPSAFQVVDIYKTNLLFVGVIAYYGGVLVGKHTSEIKNIAGYVAFNVVAICRKGVFLNVEYTTIEIDDKVFFIAKAENVLQIIAFFRKNDVGFRTTLIAGGGNIGEKIAQSIENICRTKVIEINKERCKYIASLFDHALVINGSASDKELLIEENISNIDLFLALTDQDEANILSSMLAKRLGARKTIGIINNKAYIDLIKDFNFDIVIEPNMATVSSVLSYMKPSVFKAYIVNDGESEIVHIRVNKTKHASVLNKKIEDLFLPENIVPCLIIRNEDVMFDWRDVIVEENDELILFISNIQDEANIDKYFKK